MDQRDRHLLDKQFHWLGSTSPNLGVVALTMMTVFAGGVFFGGTLLPAEKSPARPFVTTVAETSGAPSATPIMIAAQTSRF
jgi:hypothetical protein